MLDELYQEQQRRHNRVNPIIKVLLILAILFFLLPVGTGHKGLVGIFHEPLIAFIT